MKDTADDDYVVYRTHKQIRRGKHLRQIQTTLVVMYRIISPEILFRIFINNIYIYEMNN